jgi:hypothetical protein
LCGLTKKPFFSFKKNTMNITKQEREVLIEMLDVYATHIENNSNNISQFIWLAHDICEIASSGEKYEKNIRFFEVKDKIKAHLLNKKADARSLINKIINHKESKQTT